MSVYWPIDLILNYKKMTMTEKSLNNNSTCHLTCRLPTEVKRYSYLELKWEWVDRFSSESKYYVPIYYAFIWMLLARMSEKYMTFSARKFSFFQPQKWEKSLGKKPLISWTSHLTSTYVLLQIARSLHMPDKRAMEVIESRNKFYEFLQDKFSPGF